MRRIASMLLLSLVPVLAACGDQSPSQPTPVTLAGTWALQSVNDEGLPYVVLEAGSNKLEITAGQLVLAIDRTFIQRTTTRTTTSGMAKTETQQAEGAYALHGDSLALTYLDASTAPGKVNGNSITIGTSYTLLMNYRKQ